jgi:hypothetical protein
MRVLRIILIGLCFSVSQVLGEERLYCRDTAAIGFYWDINHKASPTDFAQELFTIKVVSEHERYITDQKGVPVPYSCRSPAVQQNQIFCENAVSGMPWTFSGQTYARSFLLGPPAGGTDLKIGVAYGSCTKF